MHVATWPGTNLLTNTFVVYQYTLLTEQKRRPFAKSLKSKRNLTESICIKFLLEFSVIKFLSSKGLAFHGSNLLIGSPQNYRQSASLTEHIQKQVNKSEGHFLYFSSTVGKEFIHILATKVFNIIIYEKKQAKCYSVSVDSTPDITNFDQVK